MTDKRRPADKKNLTLIDTIVLNGRVEMVDYEDRDHATQYIGVCEYNRVPTFGGYVEKLAHEFAFTPEMEEKIGWRNRIANVRMVFGDAPIDPHAVDAAIINTYYGTVDAQFRVHVSDLSGYLWTDEEFKVGGHSMIDILKANLGKWCHIEIEIFD